MNQIKYFIDSLHFKLFASMFIQLLCLSITTRANEEYGLIDGSLGNFVIIVSIVLYTMWISIFMAQYDAKLIIYSHTSRYLYRILLMSFVPVVLYIQSGNIYNLLFVYLSGSIFYLFFEYEYNISKQPELPPFYVGNTALHDRIVRKINTIKIMNKLFPLWFVVFKLLNILFSFYLIYKYWL